jgi:hypothetical protein
VPRIEYKNKDGEESAPPSLTESVGKNPEKKKKNKSKKKQTAQAAVAEPAVAVLDIDMSAWDSFGLPGTYSHILYDLFL